MHKSLRRKPRDGGGGGRVPRRRKKMMTRKTKSSPPVKHNDDDDRNNIRNDDDTGGGMNTHEMLRSMLQRTRMLQSISTLVIPSSNNSKIISDNNNNCDTTAATATTATTAAMSDTTSKCLSVHSSSSIRIVADTTKSCHRKHLSSISLPPLDHRVTHSRTVSDMTDTLSSHQLQETLIHPHQLHPSLSCTSKVDFSVLPRIAQSKWTNFRKTKMLAIGQFIHGGHCAAQRKAVAVDTIYPNQVDEDDNKLYSLLKHSLVDSRFGDSLKLFQWLEEFVSKAVHAVRAFIEELPYTQTKNHTGHDDQWITIDVRKHRLVLCTNEDLFAKSKLLSQLASRSFVTALVGILSGQKWSSYLPLLPVVVDYFGHRVLVVSNKNFDMDAYLKFDESTVDGTDETTDSVTPCTMLMESYLPIDKTFPTLMKTTGDADGRYRAECCLFLNDSVCCTRAKMSDMYDEYITTQALPSLVRHLHSTVNAGEDAYSIDFAHLLHTYGVNVRYLGYIRTQCRKNCALYMALLVEIVSRSVKCVLRQRMNSCSREHDASIHLRQCIHELVHCVKLPFHANAKACWEDIVGHVQSHFGRASLTLNEYENLQSIVQPYAHRIISYLSKCVGFFVRDTRVTHAELIELGSPTVKHDVWLWVVRARVEATLIANSADDVPAAERTQLVDQLTSLSKWPILAIKSCPMNIVAVCALMHIDSCVAEILLDIPQCDEKWLYAINTVLSPEQRHNIVLRTPPKKITSFGIDISSLLKMHDRHTATRLLVENVLTILETRKERVSCMMHGSTSLVVLHSLLQVSRLLESRSQLTQFFSQRCQALIDECRVSVETVVSGHFGGRIDESDRQSTVEWLMDEKLSPFGNDAQRLKFLKQFTGQTSEVSHQDMLCRDIIDTGVRNMSTQADWNCFVLCHSLLRDDTDGYSLLHQTLCSAASNANQALFNESLKCFMKIDETRKVVSMSVALLMVCSTRNQDDEIRCGMVRTLVKHRACINDRTYFGAYQTPLHVVARIGSVMMGRTLLNLGATLDLHDTMTPIELAAKANHAKFTELVLRKIDHDHRAEFTNRALRTAVVHDRADVAVHLLDTFSTYVNVACLDCAHYCNASALMLASMHGHVDTMHRLLQHSKCSQTIDDKNNDGWTALMYACYEGHAGVCKALIDANADLNVRYQHNTRLMHIACKQGNTEVVRLLASVDGVDMNARDDMNCTPLVSFLAGERDEVEILELLLEHKASTSVQASLNDLNQKYDVMWFAVMFSNANICNRVEYNLDKPLSKKWKERTLLEAAKFGRLPAIRNLLRMNTKVDTRGPMKRTPLMLAAAKGQKGAVKVLIAAKANLSLCDDTGYTGQRLATMYGHTEVASYIMERTLRRDTTLTMTFRDRLTNRNPTPQRSSACAIM